MIMTMMSRIVSIVTHSVSVGLVRASVAGRLGFLVAGKAVRDPGEGVATLSTALLTELFAWSTRPSFFRCLSPAVRAPAASFARPLALSMFWVGHNRIGAFGLKLDAHLSPLRLVSLQASARSCRHEIGTL